MIELRNEYLYKCGGFVDFAALTLGKDLMRGDASTLQVGYTAENATIAASEVFPEADTVKVGKELESYARRLRSS